MRLGCAFMCMPVLVSSLYLATVLTIEILQILTDAALLKRQQLEIEELRKKLEVIIS